MADGGLMPLHTQTAIFMVCLVYLLLHAAVWFALSEQRNNIVRLWCGSGIVSGIAVVFLSMRGFVSEFLFMYVGQLMMMLGNAGRCIALRMYLPQPIRGKAALHLAAGFLFYAAMTGSYAAGVSDRWLEVIYHSFYAVICYEYFIVGWLLRGTVQAGSLGPRVLMLGGAVLSTSLSFKAIMVLLGLGAADIYSSGIDQYVLIAGQFIAITLVNIGFLRIFLDRREQQTLQTQRSLAAAEERASLLSQHKAELQELLIEREEIIRQLTLSNKTAGMGALVASLAHELNQPLCAIRLNAQLVERKLEAPEADLQGARHFLDSVIADNRRAANIITKLRNLFENRREDTGPIDFNGMVRDTLTLVEARARDENVALRADFDANATLNGDQTQLQQVLLNLLNNALDALANVAQADKTILIRTERQGDRLALMVEDNGPGIPPPLQPSVFELFKTSKAQGMGVGLWLSKTVVNAHRGDIHFASLPAGGTRFRVDLPVD